MVDKALNNVVDLSQWDTEAKAPEIPPVNEMGIPVSLEEKVVIAKYIFVIVGVLVIIGLIAQLVIIPIFR